MNSLLCSIDPFNYSCLCEVGSRQCQRSSHIPVGPFLVFVSEYFGEGVFWVWAFSSLHVQLFLGGCLQLPLSSPEEIYRCAPPIANDWQLWVYENPLFLPWSREPFINKSLAHKILISGSAFGKLNLRQSLFTFQADHCTSWEEPVPTSHPLNWESCQYGILYHFPSEGLSGIKQNSVNSELLVVSSCPCSERWLLYF